MKNGTPLPASGPPPVHRKSKPPQACTGLRLALLALLTGFVMVATTACGSPPPQVVTRLEVDRSASSALWRTNTLTNLQTVLDSVEHERGRLVIATIDDNSLAHDVQRIDADFAVDDGGNSVLHRRLVAQVRSRVTATVTQLLAEPRPAPSTDVFGALVAAAQYLQQLPSDRPKRIVFLSDMVNTAGGPGRNLTAGDWNDPTARAALLTTLRTDGLVPDLHDVQVVVAGAGLTAGRTLTAAQLQGIREFWTQLFRSAGVSDLRYGSVLATDA